jgi:hypothetical protein
MNILNLRPTTGAGGTLALFDVQLSPEIKMLDMALKRTGSGHLRVFPPSPRAGRPAAILSTPLLENITAAASAAFTGGDRLARHAA